DGTDGRLLGQRAGGDVLRLAQGRVRLPHRDPEPRARPPHDRPLHRSVLQPSTPTLGARLPDTPPAILTAQRTAGERCLKTTVRNSGLSPVALPWLRPEHAEKTLPASKCCGQGLRP